jgi:hypothetical protein
MIQGTIRSTYYTEQSIVSEYCSADATMYGASILPLIFNCSTADADLLFDQTKPNSDAKINATLVQEILIRNYNCLGITSDDVGTFDPNIMVEWGRCGQPTPAPVVTVPKPVSTENATVTTPTATPIIITETSSPTTFINPIEQAPTKETTSGCYGRRIESMQQVPIILIMILCCSVSTYYIVNSL